jgi:hypothetical protein
MFLDFEYKIRTDSAYRDKVYGALETMQKTAKDATKSEKHRKLHEEAVLEYLKVSHFNIAPLLGYYYPHYPEGTPYSLKDFPFAHCYYTLNLGPNSSTTFRCGRQIGKSCSSSSRVTIRNKSTGKVLHLTCGELYNMKKSQKIS